MENRDELIRVLQTAISPVVMISGVALLVLSMTNRFARTTERVRSLIALRAGADAESGLHPEIHSRLDVQIRILYRRSRILALATSLALTSILLAALLVMTLFIHYLAGVNLRLAVIALFVLSLIGLVASVILFIKDMTLSLEALREELRDQM